MWKIDTRWKDGFMYLNVNPIFFSLGVAWRWVHFSGPAALSSHGYRSTAVMCISTQQWLVSSTGLGINRTQLSDGGRQVLRLWVQSPLVMSILLLPS